MAMLTQDQIAGIRPGAQMPSKYRRVGPRYARWGELSNQGFIYDDTTDSYYRDKSTLPVEFGGTPRQPGLVEQLTPALAAAGGIALAQEGGKGVYEAAKGGIQGLFGGGQPATASAPVVNPSIATPQVLGMNQGVASLPGGGTLMQGGGAVPPQPGGLFSIGSPTGQALGYGGVALGGYEAYQGIKEGNPLQAGLGGAGVAAGLTQLGWTLPGAGWAVAIGAPALLALAGKLGDKDVWKTEGNKLRKLAERGTYIPDTLLQSQPTHGRTREELAAIARATGGNEKFALSRNESDLTGKDIVGFSTFAEKDPTWFNRPLDERISYAQSLLDQGLVRERKGTVDVKWDSAPPLPGIAAAAAGEAAVQSVRSSTSSPGIDKQGNRIDYSRPQKRKSKGLLAGA